jgi:DNA-binding MarR family transcriptional regulator
MAADAWGALLQVHAAVVPLLDRQLRSEAGLPLSWYDVLLELQAAPRHRLTMSELGDRVVLSRTRVSRVVDELSREGLVRREANPDDARSAFATLTDAGLDRFRVAAPIYVRAIQQEFSGCLDDGDLRTLADVLGRVRDDVRNR